MQILKCRVSTRLSIKGKVTIATPKAGLARWPPHVNCPALWRSRGGGNLRVVFGLFVIGERKKKEGRSFMDCDSPLNSRNSPVIRRFLKRSRCLEKWWLIAWWRCCSTAAFCRGFSLSGGMRPPFASPSVLFEPL